KLLTRTRQDSERSHDLLMRNSRRLAQKFADDVDRVDVRALLRARRRLPKQAEVLAVSLPEVAKSWRKNRQLILNRAALELHNAGFQHRLRAIVERTKDTSALTIQSGIMASAVRLREALVDYRVEVEQD